MRLRFPAPEAPTQCQRLKKGASPVVAALTDRAFRSAMSNVCCVQGGRSVWRCFLGHFEAVAALQSDSRGCLSYLRQLMWSSCIRNSFSVLATWQGCLGPRIIGIRFLSFDSSAGWQTDPLKAVLFGDLAPSRCDEVDMRGLPVCASA